MVLTCKHKTVNYYLSEDYDYRQKFGHTARCSHKFHIKCDFVNNACFVYNVQNHKFKENM